MHPRSRKKPENAPKMDPKPNGEERLLRNLEVERTISTLELYHREEMASSSTRQSNTTEGGEAQLSEIAKSSDTWPFFSCYQNVFWSLSCAFAKSTET